MACNRHELVAPDAWEVVRTDAHQKLLNKMGGQAIDVGPAALDLKTNIDDAIAGGIGDVTSDKRGSGARFNSGKTPYRFIPARVLCTWLTSRCDDGAAYVMDVLAFFEESKDDAASLLGVLTLDDMAEAARVFEYGSKKYAAWNWAKGMPWSVPIECAKRHILAGLSARDEESELTHMGHVACNFIMLAHFERYYPEGDDRPPARIFMPASEES